ncbi:MAG: hypothetical protein JW982_13285 [Spirochaetes bacterium]|nr:hypothetical protein [Spirochaetota bacterium]
MKKPAPVNSETYIILADLLKRKRSDFKIRKVEEVLSSDLSVPQKIKKIYAIDSMPEQSSQRKNGSFIKHEINFSSLNPHSDIITRQKSEKFREIIKREFLHQSYLSFIIHDFLNIIVNFAVSKKPSILKYSYIPPKIQLNLKNALIYNSSVKQPAAVLYDELTIINEKGWMLLTREKYNLLMAFINFCRLASGIDAVLLLNSGKSIIKNIREIEKLFLTCCYKPGFCRDICNSAVVMKKSSGEGTLTEKQITALIKKILLQDISAYTMHDFLTEINILHYNRYLTFSDLITTEEISPVSNFDYEFPPNLQNAKKPVLEELEKDMNRIITDLQEINKIDKFIKYDENGDMDKTVFLNYYNSLKTGRKRIFIQDKTQPVLFIKNCIEVFLSNFEDIISGSIEMKPVGMVAVFHENIFKNHIDILNFSYNRLTRIIDKAGHSVKSVLKPSINSDRKDASSENETKKIISAAVDEFEKIAGKMISIIDNSENPVPNKANYNPVTENQILEKRVSIPCPGSIVRHRSDINGKQVLEILNDILEFCLISALEVGNSRLSVLISSKFSLKRELFSKKDNLKKITNPIEYRNIKERINFPAIFFN